MDQEKNLDASARRGGKKLTIEHICFEQAVLGSTYRAL